MKIFGIGLPKTGTSSLASALKVLGYRTVDNPQISTYCSGNLSSIDSEMLDSNDAFTDTPIPSFYRELDKAYPSSKFILTIRDVDSWLLSCKKQFTRPAAAKRNDATNQLFVDLFETTQFDEEKFRAAYVRYMNGVKDYFDDRSADLLILDIVAGDGWEKLCAFLGDPLPSVPFPKSNVTKITWMKPEDIVQVAREAGAEALRVYNASQGSTIIAQRTTGNVWKLLLALVDKLRFGGGTNPATACETARRRARRVILARLRRINPQIPVVTPDFEFDRGADDTALNHFWLVNPLDGTTAFGAPGATFSINIALIQDRVPILGVVFIPATDTAYYAMAGKAGFKIVGAGEPIPLAKHDAESGVLPPQDSTERVSGCDEGIHAQPASVGMRMCLALEEGIEHDGALAKTKIWQTAAAHAILRSAKKKVVDSTSGREVEYFSHELENEPLLIASN